MKRCWRCNKQRPIEMFSKSRRKRDGRQTTCKPCAKELHATYYQANKKAQTERNKDLRRRRAEQVFAVLCTKRCADCGEADPIVLEFDHVRGRKVAEVSAMARDGRSWRSIVAEIEKCDVRCANCHKRKTFRKSHKAQWLAKTPLRSSIGRATGS